MTVLVEKYIELPFEYSSDDEAVEYIESLMMLGKWQAICDVTYQDAHGAVVDCPEGLPELYFDDEMQVVLFKVLTPNPGQQPVDYDAEPVEEGSLLTKVRAASYLPERDDDA